MPNIYAVVPNNLVGNVTVTGDIIGKQDIRGIGNSAIGAHIASNGGAPYLALNFNPVTQLQDLAGANSFMIDGDGGSFTTRCEQVSPTGTRKVKALAIGEMLNSNAAAHTGTTTEDTIYSTTVPGWALGHFGQMFVRFYLNSTAQGATATTLRFKFGGSTVVTLTFTTVNVRFYEFQLVNLGSLSSQFGLVTSFTNAVAPGLSSGTVAVNTAQDQTFAITVQNGTGTDSQDPKFVSGLLMGMTAAI